METVQKRNGELHRFLAETEQRIAAMADEAERRRGAFEQALAEERQRRRTSAGPRR